MSFDKESQMGGMENPIGNMERPKSKKKFWILGGLGCLGLIGIVCVGGGAFFWFTFGKPVLDFKNENMAIVETSPAVEAAIGSPVTVNEPATTTSGQSIIFEGSVSGPNGSGTYTIKATLVGTEWQRDEIYIEVDGERTDLDAEEIFNLEINEGQ